MSPETSESKALVMRPECLSFGWAVAICVLPVVLGPAVAQAKSSADYAVVTYAIHQEEDTVGLADAEPHARGLGLQLARSKRP